MTTIQDLPVQYEPFNPSPIYSAIHVFNDSAEIERLVKDLVLQGTPKDKLIMINFTDPLLGSHGYNPFSLKGPNVIADMCMSLVDDEQESITKAKNIIITIIKAIAILGHPITPKSLACMLIDTRMLYSTVATLNQKHLGHGATTAFNTMFDQYVQGSKFNIDQFKTDLLGIAGLLHRLAFSYVGDVFEHSQSIDLNDSIENQNIVFVCVPRTVKQSNFHTLNRLFKFDLELAIESAKEKSIANFRYSVNLSHGF